jgi:DNA adenine methylase
MNYISSRDIAKEWNISRRRVLALCEAARIPAVVRVGNMWLIPQNAEKPEDNRHFRYIETGETARPFLKWAGGKTQLLTDITKHFDKLGNIKKYVEPFVGGGAVLFHILSNYNINKIYINDINPELINVYRIVKSDVNNLIKNLEKKEAAFLDKSMEERKAYYLAQRKKFNELSLKEVTPDIEKAALFIFLNKTCFNGLYRVNRKGEFNVPIGSYKNPLICDKDNLRRCSSLLHKVEISCGDYKDSFDFIDKDTFVYLDPPYRPLSETSSFTSYTANEFDDKNQMELAQYIEKLHLKKAKVLLSNSDPKNYDAKDMFFDKLYSKYSIERVLASRMINCNGKSRGQLTELLISTF